MSTAGRDLLLLFGGEDKSEILYNALLVSPSTKDVTLQYGDANNNYIWTHLQDNYWARWRMLLLSTGFYTFNTTIIYDVLDAVPDSDGSITYGGGGWNTSTPASALNGTNHWTNSPAVDRKITFDITGTDKIYLIISALTNGNYCSVLIDGETTLVNELPLVDGYRQLDSFADPNDYNHRVLIASGLTPATTYTVEITVRADYNAGSTGGFFWFEGYGKPAATYNTAGVYGVLYAAREVQQITYGGNGQDYAYRYLPTGASSYQWMGSDHLNEAISAVTWKNAADEDMTVSVGTPRNAASQIIVENIGTSRHSQTSTTDHANIVLRQTFQSGGMDVYHKHTWLSAALVNKAYAAMWSVIEAQMTLGHVAGDTANIYDLTPDSGAFLGKKRERLAAVWSAAHNWVAWLYLTNLSGVKGWSYSTDYAFIEDNAGNAYNKIYFQRISNSIESVNIGDVWEGTAYYRLSYIPSASTAINWI